MTFEDLVRKQVDEMEVGAVSLVQTGAVPDSNGFLVVQMGAENQPVTVDPSNLQGVCETYVGIIETAPEIALQMAAVDALAVALRSAISPENAPESVTQSEDIASKIAGWDTWQGFQEYVHENVHSAEDAIRAIDELAALQKSELVSQTTTETEEPVTENAEVAQALAAIEASEKALTQAKVALGKTNKLAPGASPDLREEDTRPLSEMGDDDGDEDTEDESQEDEADDSVDAAAGADLDEAMDGDRDQALSVRDATDKNWQNIKKTNTVVPPAATEATHPRTAPKHPAPDIAGTKGPGKYHTDPATVNQESSEEEVLQEAGEILQGLEDENPEEPVVKQGLWGDFLNPLEVAITQGHPGSRPVPQPVPQSEPVDQNEIELPDDPKVLQEALAKATARIAELETKGAARSRPASRQSDADAAPVTQGAPHGLWDDLIPNA